MSILDAANKLWDQRHWLVFGVLTTWLVLVGSGDSLAGAFTLFIIQLTSAVDGFVVGKVVRKWRATPSLGHLIELVLFGGSILPQLYLTYVLLLQPHLNSDQMFTVGLTMGLVFWTGYSRAGHLD